MSAVLIISIFLLVAASFAIFRSKRSTSKEEAGTRLPPPRSLFGEPTAPELLTENRHSKAVLAPSVEAEMLCARARRGDIQALPEAHATGDPVCYREVLDALVAAGGREPEIIEKLSTLIAASDELRASPELVEKVLVVWRESPTQTQTTMLIRIAALSDDAETFRKVVMAVFEGRQPEKGVAESAGDLLAMVESEYWLLSPDARRSGAGFVLRRTLADLRRTLSSESRHESPPSTEAV